MKLPPLSNRLRACAEFINAGDVVADIGCDHGYLGIHLLHSRKAAHIIAADINTQPLESAMFNARRFAVDNSMSFHLSDGVQNIPREFDTLVCAGMGADTMISIIESAPWLKQEKYRLILQCQSKRPELRAYLYQNGFAILKETLAKDGKFLYPVMEVQYHPSAPLTPGEYYISPALLSSGSPLLREFYERVIDGLKTTVAGLSHAGGERLTYFTQVLNELLKMEERIYGNRC